MANTKRKIPPARTKEGRENQLIALAFDVAEERMRDGTASSQLITHFLKLGSMREEKELEKLKYENELLKAKREALESDRRIEDLYRKAINSMRIYQGNTDSDD